MLVSLVCLIDYLVVCTFAWLNACLFDCLIICVIVLSVCLYACLIGVLFVCECV